MQRLSRRTQSGSSPGGSRTGAGRSTPFHSRSRRSARSHLASIPWSQSGRLQHFSTSHTHLMTEDRTVRQRDCSTGCAGQGSTSIAGASAVGIDPPSNFANVGAMLRMSISPTLAPCRRPLPATRKNDSISGFWGE